MKKLPAALDEVKKLKHWVWYKSGNKKPLNPYTGFGADAGDPETWGKYEDAASHGEGIGFEFEGSGYAGVDLDHVVLPDGSLKDYAREIVDIMDSYTEYSPSGEGLHILFKLEEPLKSFGTRNKNTKLKLEMYDSLRYFTVTGQVYGEEKRIAERTAEARKVYEKYIKREEEISSSIGVENREKHRLSSRNSLYANGIYTPASDLSDSELLERAFNSQRGYEMRSLFEGDTSRHGGDDSAADLALCNYLVWWTNGDKVRADNLFRQSRLMRAKWDERHGEKTYGERTLDKALLSMSGDGYRGYMKTKLMARDEFDVVGVTEHTEGASVGKITGTTDTEDTEGVVKRAQSALEVEDVVSYVSKTFISDIEAFRSNSERKTGYSNLDKYIKLYSGLYIVGAVSSLGKTTFCHQMADQLSASGVPVIYFSLEQSRMELVTKGIARESVIGGGVFGGITAIEVRKNYGLEKSPIKDVINDIMSKYLIKVRNETIVQCDFTTSIKEIIDVIIEKASQKPVIFVDYLQVIRPLDERQTTKDVVDGNVRAFKKLSVDYDLTIFLISSFNRQNYMNVVDFESFKESGGIEYTADVVWGLQLLAMNAGVFDKDAKLQTKRKFVQQAKNAPVRKIELVGLKNRYGRACTRFFFDYEAEYDLFRPLEKSEEEIDREVSEEFEAFALSHDLERRETQKQTKERKEKEVK